MSRMNLVIQNGSLRPPILIGSRKIQVEDTCPYDSIVEILSVAYENSNSYKAAIDENLASSPLYQIVVDYAQKGISENIYYNRALLLQDIYKDPCNQKCIDNCTINCAGNINLIIEKLLGNFPSITQIYSCNFCQVKYFEPVPVLKINEKPIGEYGLESVLKEAISESVATKFDICENCCTFSLWITKLSGMHIFVDIEEIYTRYKRPVTLDEIPLEVMVADVRYKLQGIITFTKPNTGEVGHYVSFCRRITGKWFEHDSLKNAKTEINQNRILENVDFISIAVFTI